MNSSDKNWCRDVLVLHKELGNLFCSCFLQSVAGSGAHGKSATVYEAVLQHSVRVPNSRHQERFNCDIPTQPAWCPEPYRCDSQQSGWLVSCNAASSHFETSALKRRLCVEDAILKKSDVCDSVRREQIRKRTPRHISAV